MWQALISPITSLLGQVLKNRAEEKTAIHNAKMEVIKNTASWEQLMASAMERRVVYSVALSARGCAYVGYWDE